MLTKAWKPDNPFLSMITTPSTSSFSLHLLHQQNTPVQSCFSALDEHGKPRALIGGVFVSSKSKRSELELDSSNGGTPE